MLFLLEDMSRALEAAGSSTRRETRKLGGEGRVANQSRIFLVGERNQSRVQRLSVPAWGPPTGLSRFLLP